MNYVYSKNLESRRVDYIAFAKKQHHDMPYLEVISFKES